MSGSGRADSGRGNNRRRPFRRRNSNSEEGLDSLHKNGNSHNNNPIKTLQKPQEKKGQGKWQDDYRRNPNKNTENPRNEKAVNADRPKWVPPKVNTDPLPVPDCPYCGKSIRDISQAVSDRNTGIPVHFDCVVNRITEGEKLEKDDSITYIGGGRFGIVSFIGRAEFKIKKIIEWEATDKRAEWRSEICEHYSAI